LDSKDQARYLEEVALHHQTGSIEVVAARIQYLGEEGELLENILKAEEASYLLVLLQADY